VVRLGEALLWMATPVHRWLDGILLRIWAVDCHRAKQNLMQTVVFAYNRCFTTLTAHTVSGLQPTEEASA